MSICEVEYIELSRAATELGVTSRHIRNLCEQFDWFGGKMGDVWVLTREELDRMKITPRRYRGRPKGSVKPRKPIGVSVPV